MMFLLFTLPFLIGSSLSIAADAPAPVPFASKEERSQYMSEFKRRISEEEKRFDQEEKARKKELIRGQNERRKNWIDRERRERRAFFDAHLSGPERRKYIQDYIHRRKEFDQAEKLEWVEFRKTQKETREAFHLSLDARVKKVNAAVEANLRPEF